MRILVDHAKCTGLGMCEAVAPDVFAVDADGTLTVLCERPGEDQRESLLDAVASCPTEALRLLED